MSTTRFAIATLDGPAGSGKSTLARRLAARFGWLYLDTGAMYRALALASIEAGIDPGDAVALERLARGLDLAFEAPAQEGEAQRVVLAGRDVTSQIREPEVTARVSEVSAHAGVRAIMVARQRDFAQSGGAQGLVAEGRDMGTVVFPDARPKFFVVASLEERAKRRYAQLRAQGVEPSYEEVLDAIAERDRKDSSRDVAPLAPARDATVVETSGRTVEEVLAWMAERVAAASGSDVEARSHR